MTLSALHAALATRHVDVEMMQGDTESYLSVLRSDGVEIYLHARPRGIFVQHWEHGETFAEALVPFGDALVDRVIVRLGSDDDLHGADDMASAPLLA